MNFTSCKVCSGKIQSLNAQHELVECVECGLIFSKKIFTEEEIRDTYDRLYNSSEKYLPYQLEFLRLEQERKLRLGWPKRTVINYLLNHNCREICEIGAGVGLVGVHLKGKGLHYLGIEMDEVTAAKASSLGIDVQAGSFTLLQNYLDYFDSVLGFEVIEHIQELGDFFGFVNRSLRVGGLLGFSVPNYNKVLNYSRQTDRLYQDAPPIHVNFFTEESLGNILDRFGFKVRFLKVKGRPYFNYRNVDTYYFMLKALAGRYHGPTIIGVAEKVKVHE